MTRADKYWSVIGPIGAFCAALWAMDASYGHLVGLTWVHEIGHAVAAILSGGGVLEIHRDVAITQGGNNWFIKIGGRLFEMVLYGGLTWWFRRKRWTTPAMFTFACLHYVVLFTHGGQDFVPYEGTLRVMNGLSGIAIVALWIWIVTPWLRSQLKQASTS